MLADGLNVPIAGMPLSESSPLSPSDEELVELHIAALQRAMWAHAGLLREESSLREGQRALAECEAGLARFTQQGKMSRRFAEVRALCGVARVILLAALARTESRGAHFRNDYPARDDAHFQKHSILRRTSDGSVQVEFEAW